MTALIEDSDTDFCHKLFLMREETGLDGNDFLKVKMETSKIYVFSCIESWTKNYIWSNGLDSRK